MSRPTVMELRRPWPPEPADMCADDGTFVRAARNSYSARSGTGRLLIASHAAPAGRRIGWMSGIRI